MQDMKPQQGSLHGFPRVDETIEYFFGVTFNQISIG